MHVRRKLCKLYTVPHRTWEEITAIKWKQEKHMPAFACSINHSKTWNYAYIHRQRRWGGGIQPKHAALKHKLDCSVLISISIHSLLFPLKLPGLFSSSFPRWLFNVSQFTGLGEVAYGLLHLTSGVVRKGTSLVYPPCHTDPLCYHWVERTRWL